MVPKSVFTLLQDSLRYIHYPIEVISNKLVSPSSNKQVKTTQWSLPFKINTTIEKRKISLVKRLVIKYILDGRIFERAKFSLSPTICSDTNMCLWEREPNSPQSLMAQDN